MIGYNFVRRDFTSKRTPTQKRCWSIYDGTMLEHLIIEHNPNKNPRKQPEYEQAKDILIEVTMSCDQAECRAWLTYFIGNAIAYGQVTQDKDWAYYFLAARDLLKRI